MARYGARHALLWPRISPALNIRCCESEFALAVVRIRRVRIGLAIIKKESFFGPDPLYPIFVASTHSDLFHSISESATT